MEDLYRKFKSSSCELDSFISCLEDFLKEFKCNSVCLYRILVSCEEVFLNICNYAYGGEIGEIGVNISLHDRFCKIVISDSGIRFDPVSYVSRNSKPGEFIGGLGIFLVKKFMDKIEYKRENGENNLILYKKLEGDFNGKTI